MVFKFKGCDKLRFEGFSAVRQAINAKQGVVICWAHITPDGHLSLCQFCIRGRMNDPMSGIDIRCCRDYVEKDHDVDVPETELESSPQVW